MAKVKDISLDSLIGKFDITRTFVNSMASQGIAGVYPLVNMDFDSIARVQKRAYASNVRITTEKMQSVVSALKEAFPEQFEGYKEPVELRSNETELKDVSIEFSIPKDLIDKLASRQITKVHGFMNVETEVMVTWGFSMGNVDGIKDAFREKFEAQSPSRPDERSARGSSPI